MSRKENDSGVAKPIAARFSLSRQSWLSGVVTWVFGSRPSQRIGGCHDRAPAQLAATCVRPRRSVHALCTRPTYDNVQCGALF